MDTPATAADVPQGRNVAIVHAAQPVDFVAACPAAPSLLCCTMYHLDKDTGVKSGSIMLVNVDVEALNDTDHPSPAVLQVIDTDAVFDAKWVTTSTTCGLLTATAGGTVDYWLLSPSDIPVTAPVLVKQSLLSVSPMAAVYVDVLNATVDAVDTASTKEIMVARSDGWLSRCTLAEAALSCQQEWSAHSYDGSVPAEIWVCKWDQHDNGNTAWSGGDDALLKCWDVRCVSAFKI
jgi:hypothetical protein